MNIIREIQKRLFPKTLKCVYKKDVLEYALKYHTYNSVNYTGLCITIHNALCYYGINIGLMPIRIIIPLFNNNNASTLFNADSSKNSLEVYWWPKREWNTGRLDFLKWLLEQYKNDKTNLREL